MPAVRTMYSREELLRIATLASAMNLGPEVLRKFDVIEVAEPTPAPKRREPELNSKTSVFTDTFSSSTANGNTGHSTGGNTGGKANHNTGINGGGNNSHTGNSSTPAYGGGGGRGGDGRRGGGGHGGREDNGSGNTKPAGYDRFAPPEGRFNRGNRNQETFEEGIQYELRQSALQKKRVAETMEREDRKGEHLRQALEKFKQEGNDTEAAEAEKRETDEIERLLAGITMMDEPPKTAARSRFFSAQAPTTASTEPTPATQPPAPASSALTTPSFGLSRGCSSPATASAPQASVLATPANNGTPGYVAGPWSSMKSDPNLWSTAPSMASALKQSLQQPSAPVATSPPTQIKPQQPASQQSQQPAKSASGPLSAKNMGTSAPTASAHSTGVVSASGSGGSGGAAPAPTALPTPLQSSVLGSSNGNSNVNIASAMDVKAGTAGNARQQQTPPRTPPVTPPYIHSKPPRPDEATASKTAQRSGVLTALPTGTWSAADLELVLKNGGTLISSGPVPQPHAGTAAPKVQPISAAELESMLMQRARQGSGSTGTGMSVMPPSPPQFPQQTPQQQTVLPFPNSGKAPHLQAGGSVASVPRSPPQQHPAGMKTVPSGAMLPPAQSHHSQQKMPPPPPMPSQMPAHPHQQSQQSQQQQAPLQSQQSPWMAMPRPQQAPPPPQPNGNGSPMHNTSPQQPLAAKMTPAAPVMSNGLQMPMRMNAQGQYFVDPSQLQRVYMASQPVMFRRPDGTVFMQAQPMPQPQPQQVPPQQQPPFNPFGTNAQFLFQQQQQQQRR